MNKINPLISVIMPVYNGEKYLSEAIESILNQTYENFELIIINDASIDRTEEIILSYNDPRIVYIKNKQNLQIVKTLNKGIQLAKGKYIARMDADDISIHNRFKKQLTYMKKNNIDICGSWIKTIGYKNEIWKFPESHEEIKINLFFHSVLAHPSVMIKKEVFEQFKYMNQYNKAEDYALWVMAIDSYKFANVPKILLLYRIHQNQTNKLIQLEIANKIRLLMLNRYFTNLTENDNEIFIKFSNNKKLNFEHLVKLIEKLIKFNTKTNKLQEDIFYSILAKRILTLLSINSKNCFADFFKLNNSTLNKKLKISLYSFLKQLYKCVVGFYNGK